ncbi:hypothetical protein C8K30_102346 [Promicromonospora sp. AC04]|nr:hypothetical protein C8K30_102346 [Promicromonospora sp. AC04]
MNLIPLVVGSALVLVGVLGLRRPDDWGERYQRYFDTMPRYYRSSNAWSGTPRELAIRLSVTWTVAGALFAGAAIALLFWPR